MTVVQLHSDEDWDTEDYSLVESELMPVKVYRRYDLWYWRVEHPAMIAISAYVGPFASAKLAYQNLKQYERLWSTDAAPVDIVRDRIEMAALDSTVGAVIAKQLDSPHPEAREQAQQAIRDHSYD